MASPASMPSGMLSELSARTTGLPRPDAPISAAMTTMDSDSMMHCVSPAMIVGSAAGSSTFHSSCRLVAPKASPASSIGLGHRGDAEMGQPDRGRGGEDDRHDEARRHAEAEQDENRDEVDEGRHGLHQVEDWDACTR